MKIQLVLLDRDGTINHDPGYISQPDQMTLIDGAARAIAALNAAKIRVAIVTNQSGIARGLLSESDLALVHDRMASLLAREGAHIDWYGYCPHLPQLGCQCRKPAPGLALEAMARFDVAPEHTAMVGDRILDLEAGIRAGCQWVGLVPTGNGHDEQKLLSEDERQRLRALGRGTIHVDTLESLVHRACSKAG